MKIIATNGSSLHMISKIIKIVFIRQKSRSNVCLKIATKNMELKEV